MPPSEGDRCRESSEQGIRLGAGGILDPLKIDPLVGELFPYEPPRGIGLPVRELHGGGQHLSFLIEEDHHGETQHLSEGVGSSSEATSEKHLAPRGLGSPRINCGRLPIVDSFKEADNLAALADRARRRRHGHSRQ